MSSERSIELIAPLSAPWKRTRVEKFVRAFDKFGWQVSFAGWERVAGEAAADTSDVPIRTLLRGGGYVSRTARAMYPLWMLVVFFHVLRRGRRRNFVCLGWETAFPALLAAQLTRSRVIFDDADRFSLLLRLPGPFHRLVQRLERWTSRRALVHLVPGWSRYEWRGANMVALRNTPSRDDLEKAARSAPPKRDETFVLYANGWLGETRGAPVFLEALNRLQANGRPVLMHIAGRVDSAAGEQLIAHPLVRFHGELSQHEALSFYASSDAVLTFYDPAVPINRKAESNKWGDALFFATPIIVNSEVETARELVDAGAAWAVPYADVRSLVALIERLCDNPAEVAEARRRVAALSEDYPLFDEQLELLASRLDEAGGRPEAR